MKLRHAKQRNHALTLVEVLFVVAILGLLAAMILQDLAFSKKRSRGPWCTNNLLQSRLACDVWAGDHNGKYPMDVSIANGGAMEYSTSGNAAAIFQVMANELSTPKVLLCPADKEHFAATNFTTCFSDKNISYFIGLDASKDSPQSVLFGDDNLEFGGNLIKPGLRLISTNVLYSWSADRHRHTGNIVLAHGEVRSLRNSDFTNQILQKEILINRLIIP